MLSSKWKPIYIKKSELIRVGKNFDGGYVILKKFLKETTLLISFGLSDDWSFERQFFKYSNCFVEVYDHSVTNSFWIKRFLTDVWKFLIFKKLRPAKIFDIFKYLDYQIFFSKNKIKHIQKKIGKDSTTSISLDSILQKRKTNNIFLKIDIESSEYLILDQIINFPKKIIGFTIEFHELNIYRKKVEAFLDRVKKNYRLVHIHGNNYTGLDEKFIPYTVEMTFARLDFINMKNLKKNNKSYPIEGLDQPCNKNHPDINLKFK